MGEILDPATKLYMVLQGHKEESGKIYLLPDGSKFEPDKLYKVSVNIKDIGNVSCLVNKPIPSSWSSHKCIFLAEFEGHTVRRLPFSPPKSCPIIARLLSEREINSRQQKHACERLYYSTEFPGSEPFFLNFQGGGGVTFVPPCQ